MIKQFTLSIIICLFLPLNSVIANEINLTQSDLIILAKHLEVAEPELKYEFSRIALLEMYYVYQDEIKRSKEIIPKDKKKKRKVQNWRYATQAFLDNLDRIFFEIDSGSSLDFFINRQNKLVLLVSGKPVMISGPNGGANKEIEINIVGQFCETYDCLEYFGDPESSETASHLQLSEQEEIESLTGVWSLKKNMKSEFVTNIGIVFEFNSLKDRAEKEQWATNLANEILQILKQLESIDSNYKNINWSFVDLENLPVTDQAYKLLLNDKGEFLKVRITNVKHARVLFQQLKHWLGNRFVKPGISRLIIKNAENYMKKS